MSPLRRFAGLHALALLLGWAVAAMAPAGAVRTGLLCGVGAGTVSGLFGMAVMAWALGRSMQAALTAVVTGFLLRMVLVAGGLAAAHFAHGELLAAAGGFFALYAVGQALEITYLGTQLRAARGTEERSAP